MVVSRKQARENYNKFIQSVAEEIEQRIDTLLTNVGDISEVRINHINRLKNDKTKIVKIAGDNADKTEYDLLDEKEKDKSAYLLFSLSADSLSLLSEHTNYRDSIYFILKKAIKTLEDKYLQEGWIVKVGYERREHSYTSTGKVVNVYRDNNFSEIIFPEDEIILQGPAVKNREETLVEQEEEEKIGADIEI